LKDKEAIDWKGRIRRFRSFHWTKGISSRKGHGGLPREKIVSCVGGKGKEENECVRKILVFMCGKVLFMEKMCARNKHGRNSMTKLLKFYFK